MSADVRPEPQDGFPVDEQARFEGQDGDYADYDDFLDAHDFDDDPQFTEPLYPAYADYNLDHMSYSDLPDFE
jgi:hypothetical protein